MKKQFLHLIEKISRPLSLDRLIKLSGQGLFLPFYHLVSDENCPHVSHLYPIKNRREFENDLEILLKHFEPIDLNTLYQNNLNNKVYKKPQFHLSFDDGLRECAEVITPILKRKGIPATFFINPPFIDNKALMYRYKASLLVENLNLKTVKPALKREVLDILAPSGSTKTLRELILQIRYPDKEKLDAIAQKLGISFTDFLDSHQPYLSSAQVSGLLSDGFTVGSHSMDHPRYHYLTEAQQIAQTTQSQQLINERWNPELNVFAFPFTDFGVKRSFFETIFRKERFHLTFGGAGLKSDSFKQHIHRFPMETSGPKAYSALRREYLYYLIKMPFKKNAIIRL